MTSFNIDAHIGANVRRYRLLADLTQGELAERMDEGRSISFQQLQKYEKGDNRISAAGLLELAVLLKVQPHAFYQGIPAFDTLLKSKGRLADAEISKFLSSRAGLSLARDFIRIKDEDVRRHIAMLIGKLSDRRVR